MTIGGEIGYIEDFALAQDRAAALKQLIPGTEDFYFFHCLHLQNTEQFDKAEELLKPWIERHGTTGRVREIQHRQALLTYDKSPQKTLEYLRRELGVHFNHQREVLGAKPNLPTSLDQNLISRETLTNRANQHHVLLEGFEDAAFDWLVGMELNPDRRRNLLSRLQRPDHANLPKLVVDDLNHANSGGFGSFPIHGQLLLAQLDECIKLKADLLNNTNFVNVYITKLHPTGDVDWRHDDAEYTAYLGRLWKFVTRLSPAFNSLKAHVLFHQLVFDRAHGKFDKDRLLTYIKLPRHAQYINQKYLELNDNRRFPCDLNANYQPFTLLPIIGDDEPLIRSYLHHFFVTDANTTAFDQYLNDIYLKHTFAEAKIVNGLGEPEQWASLLPAEIFQRLKERIDLDFSADNKRFFGTAEPVSLDLFVKNVPTLIVKVYEINARNFYRQNLRDVDTDINLDGLVANEELTLKYDDSPLRRIRRHFDFKSLTKPGVYVIDFIGNGKSSRVLLHKGRLQYLVRTSSAGQVFTVLNEQNEPVKDATLWLAGHEYQADKVGTITVPFSTQPGQQPIVLQQGDFCTLSRFQHEAESYSLVAGLYVDRESLLTRKKAQLVVRPVLYLNGTPVSLKLLEDVRLAITSTDHDGVASTKEVPNFALFEDRETSYEFLVPQRLSQLNFVLKVKIQNISLNQKQDLAVQETFTLNQVEKTDKIEDLHLANVGGEYIVELLGKTGEAKADRPVQFSLKHREFREPINVTLQTGLNGRVKLGSLAGIATITATGPEGTAHVWPVLFDLHSYHQSLHGVAGEPVQLPFINGTDKKLSRADVSLIELRGQSFFADHFDALSLNDGVLTLGKLPAGDFDLLLKATRTRIAIRLTNGPKREGYVLGQHRRLEVRGEKPLHIKSVDAEKEKIKIQLGNASKYSRVHLFATRYQPTFHPFYQLGRSSDSEPYAITRTDAPTAYVAGRNIGDEYRYILDRKYAKKYAGNMLERPSLLLNPWAVRSTETGDQQAQGGDEFLAEMEGREDAMKRAATAAHGGSAGRDDLANLDFLGDQSAVLLNLAPDKNGVVTINREELGAHHDLQVVAVDPLSTSYRRVSLPEAATKFVDLRLLNGLDPAKHFSQQKQVSILAKGQDFVIEDLTSAKFELYDSLARAYSLYMTLSKDSKLAEFSFILNWHKLKPEEKQALYSKHASHELTFFVSKKDPEFFRTAIQPYLANKKDKTFLDQWLGKNDLKFFAQPWNHERLNVVERVLLGQRLEGEREASVRHVRDLFDLIPSNIEQANHLFKTALQGSALDVNDALGLHAALGDMELKALNGVRFAAPADMPAPAAADAAPPGPTGGFGGGAMGGRGMVAGKPMAPAKERAGRELTEQAKKQESLRREKFKSVDLAKRKSGEMKDSLSDKKSDRDSDGQVNEALYFDDNGLDGATRRLARALYRKLDKTQEWAENNYHHLLTEQQVADLVTVNAFWRDYAAHDPAAPFFTKSLAESSRNFTEIMFALSLLDLSAEPAQHETKFAGARMTLTPGGPVIVFHEEIKEAQAMAAQTPILVSQNFFRHGDRHRQVNNEQVDKFVSDEFLIHVVYGCQVVVTNPTSSRQKLDVLLQIPAGAMPVANGQATKTVSLDLQPYNTQTVEYFFYFPTVGKFPHYPVHVSKNGELVAHVAPFAFNVVAEPTNIDKDSWDYISQHGSNDDVLSYLKRNNLHRTNLDKIAFRMADAKYFETVIAILTARHAYNHTLWSYSLRHNAPAAAREFLQHSDNFLNQCGMYLASTLVTIDPVARKTYQHLEYKPLVNARAHSLGRRRQILNDRFSGQYHQLLTILGYRPRLDDDDLMAVTYYLLLQDRIDEALGFFGRVNAERLATRLQHDYFRAYLDLFSDDHKLARAIAKKYVDHPVDRWRNVFATITAQLDEIDGAKTKVIDAEDRSQQQTNLAATEASFDFQVEAKQIVVNYQNLEEATINYYLMDIELLFSRNPFVQQQTGQFSFIKPNFTQTMKLPAKQKTQKLKLPEQFHSSNVLVEITAGGQAKSQAYYAHSLAVQLIENYGQVKVTHAQGNQPLPKTYVKVYAQMQDGSVRFFKDGYTDLRGRFDYTSLNTNELDFVQKFSLLIMSEEHGAVVREANPPKR